MRHPYSFDNENNIPFFLRNQNVEERQMHRWLRPLAALAAAVTLSGCAANYNVSGGWLGEIGDRTLPGASKELQLYRATAAFAILSSAGARVASDPDQVLGTIRFMTAVRNDLTGLAGHIWAPDPGVQCGLRLRPNSTNECLDSRVTFEADLPVLEGNLYKLAVVALPVKALEQVWGKLIVQDWLGVIADLLKPAEQLLGAAHHSAATYRAEREILATIVWLKMEDDAFDPKDTVQGAHSVLAKLEKAGSPDPDAYRHVGQWLRKNPRAFNPLHDLVRTSCARMVGRLTDKNLGMANEITGSKADFKKITDPDKRREAICNTFAFSLPEPKKGR
jgi:hypothetical protein